jgi:glutamine synthetase
MLGAALRRTASPRVALRLPLPAGLRALSGDTSQYGKFTFRGETADKYLVAQGLPAGTMATHHWTLSDDKHKVAAAVLQWARDLDASSYCHWFQPLGSAVLRHGMSGQVHNRMVSFDAAGCPAWSLSASQLMRGETDGSSYNTGGLRATHQAGGYTCIDPTSPIYVR